MDKRLTTREQALAMNGIRIAYIVGCALLTSCLTPPPTAPSGFASTAADYEAQLQKTKDYWTIKEPSPEEKAITETKMVAYYSGLVRSIKALDDGSSAADVIAKAAVSDNIRQLREWKEAQVANVTRTNEYGARTAEQMLNELPSEGILNEATSLVLRHRRGNLPDM